MEARRGGEGGRLGQLLLGTYAILASVVKYIADFIIAFSLNGFRPYLRNLVQSSFVQM